MKLFLALLMCGFLAMPVSSAYASEEKKEITGEKDYVDLTPLSVPVINEKGLIQQVSVAVSLECPMGKRDQVTTP